MESRAGPTLDEHGIPIVKPEDVIKEGYLFKQSRYLKDWRKYAVPLTFLRRWFVLTKTHILSYKDEKIYKNPTEVVPMNTCCTVKSVEEEINKPNAFVSTPHTRSIEYSSGPFLEVGSERSHLLHASRVLRTEGRLDRCIGEGHDKAVSIDRR